MVIPQFTKFTGNGYTPVYYVYWKWLYPSLLSLLEMVLYPSLLRLLEMVILQYFIKNVNPSSFRFWKKIKKFVGVFGNLKDFPFNVDTLDTIYVSLIENVMLSKKSCLKLSNFTFKENFNQTVLKNSNEAYVEVCRSTYNSICIFYLHRTFSKARTTGWVFLGLLTDGGGGGK